MTVTGDQSAALLELERKGLSSRSQDTRGVRRSRTLHRRREQELPLLAQGSPPADPLRPGSAPSRCHLYRAVLEATAYAARHNLEALELETVDRVVAVGGGAGSELWVQIVSDVSGVDQEIPAETIGACYGDARLAAEAAGLAQPGGSWSRTASIVTPDPDRRESYDALYRLYRDLHAATLPIQHALAARHGGRSAVASR